MHHIQSESLNQLFDAIISLQSREECSKFFEDICTVKELLDLVQRLDVAVLLNQGASYQTIAQQVNVSTATISRVSRCLNYGSGGYKLAIEKLKETVKTNDTEAIKADSDALEKAFYAVSEKLYAQQGGAQGAGPDMGGNQGGDNTYYNTDFEDKTNN